MSHEMAQWMHTSKLLFVLGALAAVFPPSVTATCNAPGACAMPVISASNAAGRDDLKVKLEKQESGTWHSEVTAEEIWAPHKGDGQRISTIAVLEDADTKDTGEGVRRRLEKEHVTAAELRQGNAELQSVLRQRRERARGVRSVTVTVSASASSPPAGTVTTPGLPPRVLTSEERTALSEKLLEAAKFQNVEAMRQLIGQGAEVHYQNAKGETALHWAAWNNQIEALRLLLDNGAPVDAAEKDSQTALHIAAWDGRAAMVAPLAAAGANLNARNRWGETPLHSSSSQGHEMVVRALLRAGADPSVRDNGGNLPRDVAKTDSTGALFPV